MEDNMSFKFDGLDNNVPGTDDTTIPTGVDTPSIATDDSASEENVPRPATDPSSITVRVGDSTAPIILLFGAPSSGKTMTLVRLARYLRSKGYSISVDPQFVTKKVWEYEENSAKFNKMLGTTKALKGTGRNDFLFIRVCDKFGTLKCQILEGAGEDYFPSSGDNRAQLPFPSYMTGIFNTSNKKIWMFLTEPDWKVELDDRDEYVQRIAYCKSQFFHPKRDKSIILYNKIDSKPEFLGGPGVVHIKNAKKYCNNEYSGLFQIFKNPSPWPLAKEYLCEFVPFSTGTYGESKPNTDAHYDLSHDSYPAKLWSVIQDCIKG